MLIPQNKVLVVKLIDFNKSKVDITTTADDKERDLILGEIVSVSKETNFILGELVVFGKYAIVTFKFEGEDYHFLREDDVVARKE